MQRLRFPAFLRVFPAAFALLALAACTTTGGSSLVTARPGWNGPVQNGPVTLFYCALPACGPEAVVSFLPRPDLRGASAATIMAEAIGNDAWVISKFPALGTSVDLIAAPEIRKNGDQLIVTSEKRHRDSKGQTDYRLTGIIAGKTKALSLISSSPNRKTARANYEAYLATLVE